MRLKKVDIAKHLLYGFCSSTFGLALPEMAVHSLALKLFCINSNANDCLPYSLLS